MLTIESLLQDARLGLRTLRKRPVLTLTAVLALAIGIGANTATFSVVNAVLLERLPYPASESLVAVWNTPSGGAVRWTLAYPDYVDYRASARSFERLAVYNPDSTTLEPGAGADPVPLLGTIASADLFPMLGVRPELGRVFTAEEDRPGAAPVAVISHELWERQFGADPSIVGAPAVLGNRSVTIVGVMPAGFKFPVTDARVDYYMPVAPASAEKIEHRSDMFLKCAGRLAPGVSIEQARTELLGIANRLATEYPDSNTGRSVRALPLREDMVGDTRPALLVLFGAVAFVLLIACANVANLLLASATARRREIAVRAALGASRARIVAQLLVEASLLALLGGGLGLLVAAWLLDALVRLKPAGVPRLFDAGLDARVLLFTLGASVVVTLAAGLAPALHVSRPDLAGGLKESSRGGTDGRGANRMRSALVVAQVALSVMLLVGAGLLVRSFVALRQVDPGFDATDVLTVKITPSRARFAADDARNRYFQQIVDRLSETPGVSRAACMSPLPFSGSESDTSYTVAGRPPVAPGEEPVSSYRVASAGYFDVMRIPVLSGRVFSATDDARSEPVVVVNKALAERIFPGEDPIGRSLVIGADPHDNPNPPPRRIVGVVGTAYHRSLDVAPGPEFYIPLAQDKWPSMDFVVRHQPGAEAAVAMAMRDAMRAVDSSQYVGAPRPLASMVTASAGRHEFTAMLIGAFALVALLLATIGVYGVMSYMVARRGHEIGIRMALGARPVDVVRHVVGQGVGFAAAGAVLGLVGAFVLSRYLESLLFGVSATDATTFAAGPVLLVAVAFASCLLPARRASRVDPTVALRNE